MNQKEILFRLLIGETTLEWIQLLFAPKTVLTKVNICFNKNLYFGKKITPIYPRQMACHAELAPRLKDSVIQECKSKTKFSLIESGDQRPLKKRGDTEKPDE